MVLQIGILAVLVVAAAIGVVNMLSLRSLGDSPRPRRFPMVSVLVPARNEEANIGRCIASLVDQDYPNYEILVLDDNSEDQTAAIVRGWEQRSGHVRRIDGQPLPAGWTGKNFACHQLALEAKGELLLFVDADTRHSPESVRAGVAALDETGADLLTVIPNEIMETFWEKVILPLLHFNLLCFLPLPMVSRTQNPSLAMANGQYMLFRRSAYETIGGHHAVQDAIVEDVWLSRLIKRKGFRLRILDGSRVVACRMYTSLTGIWHGFSKNLFAGFKFSIPVMAAGVLFHFMTSIFPFLSLAGILTGLMNANMLPVVVAQIGVLLFIRGLFSARFRLNYPAGLLHSLAMFIVIGMAINSARWILVAGGSKWKGRAYMYKKRVLATITGNQ